MLGLLVGLLMAGLGLGPASARESTTGSSSEDSATGTAIGTSASADETRAPDGQTVVFGIPGLTINDIDRERTPNLYRLLSEGAAANLNVRTIGSATCPASGWLSFGAGARAQAGPSPVAEDADPDDPARCPTMIAPTTNVDHDSADSEAASAKEAAKSDEAHDGDSAARTTTAQIEDFDAVKEPNIGSGYSVDYGMLARTIAESGEDYPAGTDAADADSLLEPCVAAEGPGAAYAAANEDGVVSNFTEDATATGCRLGVVDLGAIGIRSWLYDPIPNYSYTVPPNFDRETRVAEADRRLGVRLKEVRENAKDGAADPTIIVAGLGDSSGLPQLRAFIAAGPGFEPGSLSSATTRTPGLLQITDLAPGILDVLDVDSPRAVGFDSAPTDDHPQQRIDDLVAEAQKATTIHQNLSTFSITLDVIFYVLFIASAILLNRSILGRRGGATRAPYVHRFLGLVSLAVAALPMGAFLAGLVPWSRMDEPGLGLFLSVIGTAAALFVLAFIPPWGRTWRGRVGALAGANVVVLAADLATGSHLQSNSLLGYNPIVGGRYYGLGNQGAAIFIVSLFIFLGIVVSWLRTRGHRRAVIIVPVVVGLAAVFVSGNPSWGAKFGGTIAILAGLMVLLALLSKIRLTLLRLALIGVASLAILIGIAFLDWLRPTGARSHFGTFFDQIVTGEALQVVGRKLGANLHIIQINPALAIVTPLAVIAILVFLRYLLHFPRVHAGSRTGRLVNKWRGRLPQIFADADLHFGFLAAATGLGVGLVLTDSGVAVPSTGAMVLLPFLLALSAEHAEEAHR
ncbi:hypothetical protein SAMN04489752_1400 [Brevibacterium siliguriense]|uniref:Uncharacterized protein n=1 Tax=Brevibacterium siliguriense TaxID=1136497 RepID=A0A1H1R1K2_9MICO|nr:hypothetical protein [Brevibacterium siliguriense]SDS29573.1 hypothetical protein SAMN04489752_1400 [Brevibacterium siliguriense]